jgi:hypothetical protein
LPLSLGDFALQTWDVAARGGSAWTDDTRKQRSPIPAT